MDLQKTFLIAGIFIVSFLLLIEWNKFEEAQKPEAAISETLESTTSSYQETDTNNSIPQVTDSSGDIPKVDVPESPVQSSASQSSLISISTDVFDIKIDKLGGDVVKVSLKKHWAELETPDIPFELLNRNNQYLYIAQSGLIGKNGTDKNGQRPLFSSEQSSYQLKENADSLVVDLFFKQDSDTNIVKRFTFNKSDYLVKIEYLIDNQSNENWQASFFGQIKRDNSVPKTSAIGMQPFLGAATTTDEERYKKFDFDDIEDEPYKNTIEGGWIAMVQHYFISAWVGNDDEKNTFTTRKLNNQDIFIIGYIGTAQSVAAKSQGKIEANFYAGPKDVNRLEQISPYLDLTVDYGWLWWVAKPLHWVLEEAYSITKNWGWAIILLTLIIKIVLFPLSNKAYISMAAMRKVTPKMTAIREQYGDNRQKLQEEMLKLYRTEKINPMGGCLPMLLQMPVFIALYWVLMESVELRHAPFMGWIHDLSVMDPYFCLPILMGASMFIQQKMNPPPPDPTQAKVMQILPIVFTFMFLWFPAGLVLYWLVNNIISMLHQGYINKQSERASAK